MALRIVVRTGCLSLPTTLIILRITRDRHLAFGDLRQKKRRKHIKPLHLLDALLKHCLGNNKLKHTFQW